MSAKLCGCLVLGLGCLEGAALAALDGRLVGALSSPPRVRQGCQGTRVWGNAHLLHAQALPDAEAPPATLLGACGKLSNTKRPCWSRQLSGGAQHGFDKGLARP